MDSSLRLPTELWLAVFKDHFQLTGIFDTSALEPLLRDPRSYTISESNFTWRNRWKLILVSKQWCILSLPLLYEHVTIFHLKRLKALASALNIGSVTSNISGRPIGHGIKIKRIDIMPSSPQNWTSNHIQYFSTVHSLCPNLEIFCDVSGNPTPLSSLSSVLGDTNDERKPLRHIRWALGSSTALLHTMQMVEKLGTIEIMTIDFGACGYFDFEDQLSLPCLHTLRIEGVAGDAPEISALLRWVSLWEIPVLIRLILGSGFAWIENSLPFFMKHGPKIKYLDVVHIGRDHMHFAYPMVARFLQRLVNLENLVINEGLSPKEFPPSLSRITIHTSMERFPASNDLALWCARATYNIGEIIRDILKITDRRLSSVRLLNFEWNMLDESHWSKWGEVPLRRWEGWIQELESQGVRLEDEFGGIWSS
jgi:hypothetical protein